MDASDCPEDGDAHGAVSRWMHLERDWKAVVVGFAVSAVVALDVPVPW
ncbi:hypothetical protein ACFQJD_05155 [Haloplanus sp. GCM10025708]